VGRGRVWGKGGEMIQTLYADMNKIKIKKKSKYGNGLFRSLPEKYL
jgi:hypothetical protein